MDVVHRSDELHAPVGGMRINRDKVLAIETISLSSDVAQAILADKALRGVP